MHLSEQNLSKEALVVNMNQKKLVDQESITQTSQTNTMLREQLQEQKDKLIEMQEVELEFQKEMYDSKVQQFSQQYQTVMEDI